MPVKSGRHHVGNFDLPTQTQAPPVPATSSPPIPATQVPLPRPAPPARVRMGGHRTPSKSGPSERAMTPLFDLGPMPKDEPYVSPDDRLTGLQKEILAALDTVVDQVRPDLMLEVRNIVRGNLKSGVITPSEAERKVFEHIGVPGY